MKSPESFSFLPEDDSEKPEERTEDLKEIPEDFGVTPEFNEDRIDRERLRNAIGSALSDNESTDLPATIEEFQERATRFEEVGDEESSDESS